MKLSVVRVLSVAVALLLPATALAEGPEDPAPTAAHADSAPLGATAAAHGGKGGAKGRAKPAKKPKAKAKAKRAKTPGKSPKAKSSKKAAPKG